MISAETGMPASNKKLRFLAGGGQMSARILAFDWTGTPLGPPAQWSQSLKTSVNLMLNSQQPVWIGWGEENTFLYNDSYIEVLGLAKHAWALGQPAAVVWAEIWDFCGPLSDKVYQLGESSFVNDTQLFMDRGGMLEEVYYSFSYSPIYDETGKVGGLFCPNIETTAKMLNARRLHTLSELAVKALIEKTTQAACVSAFHTLSQNREDIPFALLYLLDNEGRHATLEQVTGLLSNEMALSPAITDLSDRAGELSPWPLAQVLYSYKSQVVPVRSVKGLPLGLADQPVAEAVVLPVAASAQTRPMGVLIVGVNPTRRLDPEYSTFYELLAGQVATAIQNARTSEEARKRNDALAELDRSKTVFFSNISHEFRTPLTLILGSLEEMLHNDASSSIYADRVAIEATHRNAMRLLRLVNALLDFSRIESGRAKAEYQRVDLAQYTADLAANFRSVMEKGGLNFLVDCQPLEEATYVDKEMWEKIVLNLLSNAFKYTLSGQVSIRLYTENGFAVLAVQDTGVGIPAAELPRMFERFHRVQNVVGRSFEGTGIGLSLVSELVKLHGGTISVDSQKGEGSTFMVYIPLGKTHLQSDQVREKENALPAGLSSLFLEESVAMLEIEQQELKIAAHESSTVLIVDDNADMRAHIRTLLGRHYHVVTANNGAEALEIIMQQPPTLVLSDIMMPVMDGLELLRAIKENPRTAQLPVVLLSARAGEEARIEGLNVGADDYLVKPFSAKELLARVRSQIRIVRTRAHVEQQLRNLFTQAPVAICILRGPQHIIEMANERMLEIWGKTAEQVMAKPVLEGLPEVIGQGYEELLDGVLQTGERYVATESPLILDRNGRMQQVWVKFVYEPLREEDGHVSGIMVLAHEITALVEARQLAQQAADSRRYAYDQIRNLFLQAPTAIQILRGPDFVIELVNNRLLELWGRTEAEVINRPLFEVIPEVKAQGFDQLLTHVYQTGERFVAEEIPLNFLRDGQLIQGYSKLVYEALREPDGRISGIMVVGDDITPQVLARQKIEESEQRLNNILSQVNAGIAQVDTSGNFIEANKRYCQIVGRSREELLRMNLAEITHPEDMEKNLSLLQKCMEAGEGFIIEKRFYRPDQSIVWVNNSVSRVTTKDGYFLTAVTIDITEQVEARQYLQESENRFRTLAETLPQLVWITDGQGAQEYASSRWEEYSGIAPTGADTWAQMVHPDDISFIGTAWQASMHDGAPYKVEVRLKNKQGHYRWHFVHGEPIRDTHGHITKWIGAFTDIHDQKTVNEVLEQQVAERTAALFASNESLEANYRQLLRANEELESFNYVASHDLQEPLRKIQTFANFLKVKRHDEAAVSLYLDKIASASQRMSDLVQALLQYSRLENATEFEPTDLNLILNDVQADFELTIKDKQAVIHRSFLPLISAVPVQMHQLFSNLLGNALKFTHSSPVITISARTVSASDVYKHAQLIAGKEYAEIRFSDNGIGFEPQYAELVFQLFKRLHSRDEFSGTGIGLSICKKIVEHHHGLIRAESVPGEGTSFIVWLPTG